MARVSESVGFAVAAEDRPRLDRLVERFGHGNRSAFLREAMARMEAADRADRLRRLQAYGVQQSAARGLTDVDVSEIVDRVLRASQGVARTS